MILNSLNFDLSAMEGDGLTIFLVGYLIVFVALVTLFFVFNTIPKLLNIKLRSKLRKEGKIESAEQEELSISGEVNAAISTALYLYLNEMHDQESGVITIKKVSKRYSPWSSKIYGLNNLNRSN